MSGLRRASVFVSSSLSLGLLVCRVNDDSVHVLLEDDGRFIIAVILRWVKVSHTLTVIGHFRFLLVSGVSFALIVLAFSPTFAFTFALRVDKFSFAFLTSFSFVELRVVLCGPSLIVVATALIVVIVVWFSRPVFVGSASAFAFIVSAKFSSFVASVCFVLSPFSFSLESGGVIGILFPLRQVLDLKMRIAGEALVRV